MATTTIKDVNLKIGTETQFQSKLKDLPLNTLVGTTDPIQEGELDTSIINKLDKAENALPKPTNDTTGSAGQVLKKTANGSEWGDAPSGGGGEAVTPSGATASATSGTFTSAEWTKLQADKNNYILFNNEIYRLSDTGHEGTEGIWSYVHTGWDGTAMRDKSINVTISTGAWTLVQGEASSGGKLYLHSIYISAGASYLYISLISSRKEKFTFDELQQNRTLFTRDKTIRLHYTDNTPAIYECDDIGFGAQADWTYLGAHYFKTYPYSPLPREIVTLGTYSTFSDTVTEL